MVFLLTSRNATFHFVEGVAQPMRRTRIIGTIGPASDDPETLETLLKEGLDITRLNYSHGDLDGKTELIAKVRAAEKTVGKYVGILADLPGPKLRLGTFPGKIDLEEGQSITLSCGVHDSEDIHVDGGVVLPVPYEGLSLNLRVDDPILLNDGLVRLKVVDAPHQAASKVGCVVIDSGPLSSRKGINVPATIVDLPSVGPKDKAAIAHAIEHGLTSLRYLTSERQTISSQPEMRSTRLESILRLLPRLSIQQPYGTLKQSSRRQTFSWWPEETSEWRYQWRECQQRRKESLLLEWLEVNL